jgi:hypothetical protein
MADESKAAVAAALLGKGALAVLKGIADAGNQALLFLGMACAGGRRPSATVRPRKGRLPLGPRGLMLFTLGGAFSIWEGVRHYLHPSERQSLPWAYGVLAGGFVSEAISLGVALRSLWRGKAAAAYSTTGATPATPRW